MHHFFIFAPAGDMANLNEEEKLEDERIGMVDSAVKNPLERAEEETKLTDAQKLILAQVKAPDSESNSMQRSDRIPFWALM